MIDPRYNRTFADKFNEWTGQPVFWAAIASLGLHGILFAALPSFSSGTPDLDDRTVSVVELSDEDLQRLPDFPELDIPDLPNVEDPYDFELDPLENWDDVLKDLGIEADEPEASIPSSPGLLTPLPRSPLLPPPITVPQTLPRWGNLPRIPAQSLSPAPGPTPVPSPTPSPSKGPEPDEAPVNNDEGTPAPEPEVKETPPLTEEQIEELRKERLAQIAADNQRKGQAIADYLDGAQQVNNLVTEWISQRPQGRADDPLIAKEVSLPLDACAAGQDAKANLYVTVGRNNQVVEKNGELPNPVFLTLTASEFITSGGKYEGQYFDAEVYKLLDLEALNVVQDYDYSQASNVGQKRWYSFEVNFIYDEAACAEYLAQQAAESNNSSATEDNANSPTPSSPANDSGDSTEEPGDTSPPASSDAEATPPPETPDDTETAEPTTPQESTDEDTDEAETTTPPESTDDTETTTSPESTDDSGTAEDLL